MKKIVQLTGLFLMLMVSLSCANEEMPMKEIPEETPAEKTVHAYPEDASALTEQQWREKLTAEEYRVLRENGTERPHSGELTNFEGEGIYRCAACGVELFRSEQKFHSGCGWPAFYDAASAENVVLIEDKSHGMTRTEVRCAVCDSHLGHVFYGEGFATPTDARYCINSVCLDFAAEEEQGSQVDASSSSVEESAVEASAEAVILEEETE